MSQDLSLSEETLQTCKAIRSAAGYRDLLTALQAAALSTQVEAARRAVASFHPNRQAQALLILAANSVQPDPEKLALALTAKDELLISAAAFCFSCTCEHDFPLQRRLLLGPSPWEEPRVSENARYALVRLMGFSGRSGFGRVLLEAVITQPHFGLPGPCHESLLSLGFKCDGELTLHDRSIAVNLGHDNTILISEDSRFSGTSNCRGCKFFPCRVNQYYPGAIEDCSLWDRTNPEGLGSIRDLRWERQLT